MILTALAGCHRTIMAADIDTKTGQTVVARERRRRWRRIRRRSTCRARLSFPHVAIYSDLDYLFEDGSCNVGDSRYLLHCLHCLLFWRLLGVDSFAWRLELRCPLVVFSDRPRSHSPKAPTREEAAARTTMKERASITGGCHRQLNLESTT